jgi:DNA recombination protein RmuC
MIYLWIFGVIGVILGVAFIVFILHSIWKQKNTELEKELLQIREKIDKLTSNLEIEIKNQKESQKEAINNIKQLFNLQKESADRERENWREENKKREDQIREFTKSMEEKFRSMVNLIKDFQKGSMNYQEEANKQIETIRKEMMQQVDTMHREFERFIKLISGSKTSGKVGETLLEEVLKDYIRSGVVVKKLKIGPKEVEFAWKLEENKYIPIDSKMMASKLKVIEEFEKGEKTKEELKKEIEKTIKDRIKELKKYQSTSITTKDCIAVVPEIALEVAPELISQAQEKNIFLCSYRDVVLNAIFLENIYKLSREKGDLGKYREILTEISSIFKNLQKHSENINTHINRMKKELQELESNISKGTMKLSRL